MRLLRYLGLAVLTVLVIGLAAPYVDAGGYRDRTQSALERALNRKVTVGKVRFNLLTGPGFTVDDVTIGEDPNIGIEPIAYVETLRARVRLTTLWTNRLSFSTLRLENPTVNLAKGDNGMWNFQLLVRDAAARAANSGDFPSIEVRSGRIDFKFGDYKTIFYLSDADVDVTPLGPDRLDMRFSGQPARTDHAAENFGRLLGRGVWKRTADGGGEVDANLELDRSGISDLARLIEGHTIGVHGIVVSRMHVTGRVDQLHLAGQLRIEDIHRWDLMPPNSGGWDLKLLGTANLLAQQLDVETSQEPGVPIRLRFRASNYLKDPEWAAVLEVKDAPVAPFVEVARHMGAQLPQGFSADGKVAGTIGYSRPGGVRGQLEVHDSSLRVENAPPLDIRTAEVTVDGNDVRVGPSTVALSGGQTAEIQAAYQVDTNAVTVEITTRGMNVTQLHAGAGPLFGAGAIPVLEACRLGTWRGSLKYTRDTENADWSGAFELHGARVDVDGLAEPLRVASAAVVLDGPKIVLSRVEGHAGAIGFRGEYRHDRPGRPDRLTLDIPEAGVGALERLFRPALTRDAGLLARLRIRTPQVPDWLRLRSVDAAVKIGRLTLGDEVWSGGKMRAIWDGTTVRLTGLQAVDDDAQVSGQMVIELAAASPHYRMEGKVEDLPYHGGTLTVEGRGETRGTGIEWLANARASGTFAGDTITFPPEAEFRSISGNFELLAGGRLKLTTIQAAQGVESYAGASATQSDGRTVVELTSGKRVLRVPLAK